MTFHEPDDDEDWNESDGDFDAVQDANCPECGGPVAIITDKCPACGYWLSEGDRRAMWSSERRPLWFRATAWTVLAAFLFALLVLGLTIF